VGTKRNGKGDAVEGFRVLTLLYSLDELPSEQRERLEELFKRYRAVASLYFWSKRLGLREGVEQALERARELVPYYWRKSFDDESPFYAFNDVEEMKRPRKHVLKFPLTEALQVKQQNEKCTTGAYIDRKESKLVVRLGNGERIELPIPKRAMKWLKDRVDEIEKKGGAPLKVHRTVRLQWREDENPETLKVQIVLRVERPRPERPDPKKRAAGFRGRQQRLRHLSYLRCLRRGLHEDPRNSEAAPAEPGAQAEGGSEAGARRGARQQTQRELRAGKAVGEVRRERLGEGRCRRDLQESHEARQEQERVDKHRRA